MIGGLNMLKVHNYLKIDNDGGEIGLTSVGRIFQIWQQQTVMSNFRTVWQHVQKPAKVPMRAARWCF
jgi:hypothetical protein